MYHMYIYQPGYHTGNIQSFQLRIPRLRTLQSLRFSVTGLERVSGRVTHELDNGCGLRPLPGDYEVFPELGPVAGNRCVPHSTDQWQDPPKRRSRGNPWTCLTVCDSVVQGTCSHILCFEPRESSHKHAFPPCSSSISFRCDFRPPRGQTTVKTDPRTKP